MIKEYKTIHEIASPLMIVEQVAGVTYDELCEIQLPDGSVRRGKVLEVNGDRAVIQVYEDTTLLKPGAPVKLTGAPLSVTLGPGLAEAKLEVAIDKEGGICTDDCSVVTKLVDPLLDEMDPIEESYSFQVSSPGVERELKPGANTL